MKFMKDRFGVDGKLEDFSFSELDIFIDFVDALKDDYQL